MRTTLRLIGPNIAVVALTCLIDLQSGKGAPPANEKSVEGLIREAAKDYQKWGPIDNRTFLASTGCAPPKPHQQPLTSKAFSDELRDIDKPNFVMRDEAEQTIGYARSMVPDDARGLITLGGAAQHPNPAQTHFLFALNQGIAPSPSPKLFSVFAKDRVSYSNSGNKSVPVGQTIVKEVYAATEIAQLNGRGDLQGGLTTVRTDKPNDRQFPYFQCGDSLYRAAKTDRLFIMIKLDSKTPDTDNGWVYGTATPEINFNVNGGLWYANSADPHIININTEAKVTSAGRVASCMGCHQKAKNDRLFGLPSPEK
jgi:hypothetical protein